MADIIAGIAPRVDTHSNWTSLNPTLGKDNDGKSYGQIIISTGSPVGDILVWGNDETYNTAYAAGQYAPVSDTPSFGATTLGDTTLSRATVSGTLTVGNFDSLTVTGSATLGSESVLNVNAATATITVPSGLPIGTRKKIRKISSSAGTITINRSGSDTFTRAGLTSVTLTSDGDFWEIEKVSSTRWELVDGVESGSNGNNRFIANSNGTLNCYGKITAGTGNLTADFAKEFDSSTVLGVSITNTNNTYSSVPSVTTTTITTTAERGGSNIYNAERKYHVIGRWYA